MKHNATISISRPQGGGGKYISIDIDDDDAGIRFLSLEIPFENFVEALTGLAYSKCSMEFRGLENVGKKIERETLEFKMPEHDYGNRKSVAIKESAKLATDGWSASKHFGSQGSFFERDGSDWARTGISRWVDKKGEQNE